MISHHSELQVLLFTVISFKLNISRYWQDFLSKPFDLLDTNPQRGERLDSIT